MEHVIVTFPTSRNVFIDGEKNGRTNESLRVDAGTHIFDLGSRKNYNPGSRKVAVSGTTVLKPKKIAFTKIEEQGDS